MGYPAEVQALDNPPDQQAMGYPTKFQALVNPPISKQSTVSQCERLFIQCTGLDPGALILDCWRKHDHVRRPSGRIIVCAKGPKVAGSTPSTVQRSLSFHGQGTATLY